MATRQASQELIFICLKFGITYKSIQIDRSNPNVLSELHKNAVDIVSKAIGSLEENSHRHHIKLFLISPDHEPSSLKLITRSNDLTPTCFIEIIIWRSDQEMGPQPRDHLLAEHNYKKPTYCSSCDYFMWGLMKQVCVLIFNRIKNLYFSKIRVNVVNYVDVIFIINALNIYQLIVQV
jgi:hypothetical protein